MQNNIVINNKINKIKTFGNSMFPLLKNGDIVYLRKINFIDIKVNDIICFRKSNKLVTHRVIYKSEKFLITKGDNNPYADEKIKPAKIIGKVNTIKRKDQKLNIDDLYLFQSSIYFDEIKKIIQLYERNKIDFVILKGLPLHLFLEKKYPRRIYADCDILISKKDLKKAKKLLISKGYSSLDFSLSQKHQRLKDKEVEESYIKLKNGFSVVFDIHEEAAFMMTQLGRLDFLYPQKLIDEYTKSLLKNKIYRKIEDVEFPMLSIENQIIYLFLHLFHHNFRGSYRYDILLNIFNKPFNTEKLIQIIEKYKFNNYIFAGLALLNKYYKDPTIVKLLLKLHVPNSSRKYIQKEVLVMPIFDNEGRIGGGVSRFLLLFNLSPKPLPVRFLTIFNMQVLYSIYWVIILKIKSEIEGFKFQPYKLRQQTNNDM